MISAERIALPNNFKPRPYQRRYMAHLDNGGKRAMAVWHRRAGKDLVALHQANKMAHERKAMYWHSLPTYRQAKKAIWDGFTKTGERIMEQVFPGFLDPGGRRSVVKRKNESELLIELKCGSMIQLVGSDSIDSLVGAGPAHVTFSEFALCKPSSWDLVRPMLQENGGSASFITTPRGNNHAKKLYDLAKKDPSRWFCELLTIFESGAFADPQAIIDEERASGMQEELIRQEYQCDWTAALLGSVWGDLLEKLEKAGGLEAFEHERDNVFVNFDLGISDSTSMWAWRPTDTGADFLAHHNAHGKPMSYYFDKLDDWVKLLSFRFARFILPHDARQRTLQTGEAILDQFEAQCRKRRWGDAGVTIGPELSLMDGIQAGRWLLQQNTRFHPRCVEGVESLKHYHYAYDEERKTFSKKPDHDWSSHDADGFRYSAIANRVAEFITRKPSKPKAVVVVPHTPTIAELFADDEE